MVRDAVAVEEAGAFCLVLEGLPTDVAAEITHRVSIPTVGIGAGPHCDGQVLVSTDLLGMNLSFKPKFVKRYETLEDTIIQAVQRYSTEVREGVFPAKEHSFNRRPRKVAKLY